MPPLLWPLQMVRRCFSALEVNMPRAGCTTQSWLTPSMHRGWSRECTTRQTPCGFRKHPWQSPGHALLLLEFPRTKPSTLRIIDTSTCSEEPMTEVQAPVTKAVSRTAGYTCMTWRTMRPAGRALQICRPRGTGGLQTRLTMACISMMGWQGSTLTWMCIMMWRSLEWTFTFTTLQASRRGPFISRLGLTKEVNIARMIGLFLLSTLSHLVSQARCAIQGYSQR
mmetsp:Transcript_59574/g.98771  ORF Transcript_59574/g.98771 Transcript_59574/m.98771 type:complete len:224 (-) Transcript_59574:5529-6200(-)